MTEAERDGFVDWRQGNAWRRKAPNLDEAERPFEVPDVLLDPVED